MPSNIKGSIEVEKKGHLYRVTEVIRNTRGTFFVATRDKGHIRFFDTKRDVMSHYPTIVKEIEEAFKEE